MQRIAQFIQGKCWDATHAVRLRCDRRYRALHKSLQMTRWK